MNIHEYQAKELLARHGVPVPPGQMVDSVQDAARVGGELGYPVMVKIQIHAGGRGKAGGIKKADNESTLRRLAQEFLGRSFVTAQTGGEAKTARRLLIERSSPINKEYYAGITYERKSARPVLLVSSEGGVEIEEVARKDPGKIVSVPIDPFLGLLPHQGRSITQALGMTQAKGGRLWPALAGMYQAFVSAGASTVEINPLAEMGSGEFLALDAKVVLDDNQVALRPELQALNDPQEEDPMELKAKRHGLSYVKMDGTIGCMVNGAGLAMATLDIITLYGLKPANFLDVGGSASAEQIQEAFQIILGDQRVGAVFVNIFGGIMRCERIAEGIIQAVRKAGLRVPLVVRLEGTHVELGRRLLQESGLAIVMAQGIEDGVKKLKEILK
ncbi:MAG: ADP-forming succinate--CoA ligase subunit beta [Candidatus Omnitrophica bacterium]|nr:ADP-forming succinate--CoA ligase subunit beta [Candidatus Omnitrophota bacterium]